MFVGEEKPSPTPARPRAGRPLPAVDDGVDSRGEVPAPPPNDREGARAPAARSATLAASEGRFAVGSG